MVFHAVESGMPDTRKREFFMAGLKAKKLKSFLTMEHGEVYFAFIAR
jgi:hypothetical protein